MTRRDPGAMRVESLGKVAARAVDEHGNAYRDAAVHLARVRRPGAPASLEMTCYGPDGSTMIRLSPLKAATLSTLLGIAARNGNTDEPDDAPRPMIY